MLPGLISEEHFCRRKVARQLYVENIESAAPERYWLFGRVQRLVFGVACFFPAFFSILLITIPWSKHMGGEAGRMGGNGHQFLLRNACASRLLVYMLRRAIRSNRAKLRFRVNECNRLVSPVIME